MVVMIEDTIESRLVNRVVAEAVNAAIVPVVGSVIINPLSPLYNYSSVPDPDVITKLTTKAITAAIGKQAVTQLDMIHEKKVETMPNVNETT